MPDRLQRVEAVRRAGLRAAVRLAEARHMTAAERKSLDCLVGGLAEIWTAAGYAARLPGNEPDWYDMIGQEGVLHNLYEAAHYMASAAEIYQGDRVDVSPIIYRRIEGNAIQRIDQLAELARTRAGEALDLCRQVNHAPPMNAGTYGAAGWLSRAVDPITREEWGPKTPDRTLYYIYESARSLARAVDAVIDQHQKGGSN